MIRPRGSDLLLLTVAALVARIAAALPVDYSPYTDPAYYAMVAEQLTTGHGFSAPVLWSFLEVGGSLRPTRDSVPSNGHWMPLTSIVAAAGMALLGPDLRAGQIPIVILGVALVPFTYLVGLDLYQSRRVAVVAAVLAIFAGPLLIMYPTIDNFAVFGAAGAVAIWAAIRATRPGGPRGGWWSPGRPWAWPRWPGWTASCSAVAPLTAWLVDRGGDHGPMEAPAGPGLALLAAGAVGLAVMAPWLARNLATFGSAFPSAGGHTLWITSYNEQFSISADPTPASYLAWGGPTSSVPSSPPGGSWRGGRWSSWAGSSGSSSPVCGASVAAQDLAPFTVYWLVMFFAMGAVFTFHAPHGAYYHSAAAWLPFALPMAVASTGPVLTAVGRWWAFLRRPPTHRFVEVAALGAPWSCRSSAR